ncbi:MAG TPA: GNAT family N-acetyltransferase [Mucilaginibacter sp.]|nr:GNAT family N-acetyltransferase [Mucilaginibacter sp.]
MHLDKSVHISVVSAGDLSAQITGFGELLHACVHQGASIGFILPFSQHDAESYWQDRIIPALQKPGLIMLAARKNSLLAGTVQLDYDTMPNQPHRAEVRKLMVHPTFRRQGIARLLMNEIEQQAYRLNRSLLTLDTRTGDAAEPLYTSLGFRISGVIPGYCLDPFEDKLDSTTIMYKPL